MKVSKQAVAARLGAYLRHESSLAQLVDWAENALLEGDFEASNASALSHVVARLGVADVREFGLSWDDCAALLHELGYSAKIELVPA
ncbi:MAG: hypothetical protein KJ579_05005 [Verrucomicrobia bacterium]|nr:hypothetical protein [Verrucomicrobiota bacterium]